MKKYLTIIIILIIASCSNSSKNKSYDSSLEDNYYQEETYSEKSYNEGGAEYDIYDESIVSDDYTKDYDAKAKTSDDFQELEKNEINEGTISENTSDEEITDTSYLNTDLSERKIIKTATLNFKVKNVETTTDLIEDIARAYDGYTSLSNLKSYLFDTELIPLNNDSVLKVCQYNVSNTMQIIVPKENFDQVMKDLSKLYIYLDSREIKTEDVSIIFLRNKLKAVVKMTYEKRMQDAIDDKGKKLNDIISAEQKAQNLADKAIEDKIANYTLQDKIDYSRINITMYQASSVYQEVIENTNLSDYKPSILIRAGKAIKSGWNAVLDVFVAILYIWPIIFIVIIIIFLIKRFSQIFKNKKK